MINQQSKILIVDDNPVNCAICEEILAEEYTLQTADCGEAALELAATFEPDLVLLDVMMPGIDGLEVCRRLRQSVRPWVKIIMVSAKVQTSDRLAGYEAGADDYLTKPFDEDELIAKVRVHLRLKSVEEINDVKQQLLQVLQHGNRTPMTHILANADILLDLGETLSNDERDRCTKAIKRGAQRLHKWLAAGEYLVALKTGQFELSPESIDLANRSRQVADRILSDTCKNIVQLRLEVPEDLTIEGDAEFFDLLVDQLLTDAIARSPQGSQVSLRIEMLPDDRMRVAVARDGESVSKENLANMFEPFGAPDDVLHNVTDGMELAIAREVTHVQGGLVRAVNLPSGGIELQAEVPVGQQAATPPQDLEPTGIFE